MRLFTSDRAHLDMALHTPRLGCQRPVLSPQAGFTKDGRILALDMEHYSNGGATLDESLLVSVLRSKLTLWEVLYKAV